MPLSQGQILNNRYRIVKLLGQGGFGFVYRAWDLNIERPVALKESLDISDEAQRQFKREAQILFDTTHPNLPKFIDHFIIQGKGQYLVMEYIEGDDLQVLLNQNNGPFSEARVLNWINQVCDALIYLHSQEPPIIHRDIKPANIKIRTNGEAVLVDFGIAKIFDPNLKTTIGAQAVTSGYSPPEQYGGDVTDAQSDVYALAATTYTLLTGQVPPISIHIITGSKPPVSPVHNINNLVSERVGVAIEQGMQTSRETRTKSVQSFKKQLLTGNDSILTNSSVMKNYSAVRTQDVPSQDSNKKSTGWLKWLIIPLLLFLSISVFLILQNANSTEKSDSTNNDQLAIIDYQPSPKPSLTTEYSPTATIEPAETNTQTVTLTVTPKITLTPTNLPVQILDKFSVQMVLVPAGYFLMGSEEGTIDESPEHEVYLDNYYIDISEVTNSQYSECIDAGVCDPPDCDFYLLPSLEFHPVVCINWQQANRYCAWREARLPTEAEWEKAASWDSDLEKKYKYPWGDNFDCKKGNFDDETIVDGYVVPGGVGCDGFDRTSPVMSFQKSTSPNGTFDMAGNVWEWVSSQYWSYPYDPNDGREDLESIGNRVLRGGSWMNDWFMRTTARFNSEPEDSSNVYGFRCAKSP